MYTSYTHVNRILISLAVASLLRWSRGEENGLLSCIFGRVAELNWMWKEAMDEFDNQVSNKRNHTLKMECSNMYKWIFMGKIIQFIIMPTGTCMACDDMSHEMAHVLYNLTYVVCTCVCGHIGVVCKQWHDARVALDFQDVIINMQTRLQIIPGCMIFKCVHVAMCSLSYLPTWFPCTSRLAYMALGNFIDVYIFRGLCKMCCYVLTNVGKERCWM